jgi:hypothetical protein
MLFDSSPSSRTVYFEVNLQPSNSSGSLEKGTAVSRPVSNSPISGISLGSIAFTAITLSGHIDFKINAITPQDKWIEAYGGANNDYLGQSRIDSSGNWAISINAFDSPSTVSFWVSVGNDISYDVGSRNGVYNIDISDIELGSVNKQVVTLSGTVSGTVSDTVEGTLQPAGCTVLAYIGGENILLGGASVGSSQNWSMQVEAPASSKTVSFIVAPVIGNSQVFFRLGSGFDRPVYNSDVSGINLSGTFVTKPLNVTITTNGTTPLPGVVYVSDSEIVSTDLMDKSGQLKAIAGSYMEDTNMGGGSSPVIPSSWNLKVPNNTTGNIYFVVMTESNGVYISTSPVSYSSSVTLNTSNMEELSF